ncbi:YHYH protein [Flagellimonas algicola]|uniref:YHYH protein n=1 Tax=Flagellimonas algicola TaxID=2583815 RepID=A0ABY2WH41_9FLAO|nr:YHYH protein [Allomuricauda algicola]TMU50896.1 YHYH protein [Allomuricauda algicola]
MKKKTISRHLLSGSTLMSIILAGFIACSSDAEDGDDGEIITTGELHAAFSEFDEANTDIYLEGTNVVIETNGLPNHSTVYWGVGQDLYLDEPDVETTPSIIPNFNAEATLRVSQNPELASSSSSTNMGAIGIAISGAAIFNDQEGSGPLNEAAASLDYTGGHIGPAEYHYHLEPTAWSEDDENLIGIMADGFFIYGRKCDSTGTYPTDLDASGGHTSTTQHTDEAEYHYHMENELYLNQYYIIFPGDYQGSPNAIN